MNHNNIMSIYYDELDEVGSSTFGPRVFNYH